MLFFFFGATLIGAAVGTAGLAAGVWAWTGAGAGTGAGAVVAGGRGAAGFGVA